MFTITVNYPSDLGGLTCWSKRLFALYYACGALGAAAVVGGFSLGIAGKPWWLALGLIVLGLLLGAAVNGIEALMSEVDHRRYELIQAQRTTGA